MLTENVTKISLANISVSYIKTISLPKFSVLFYKKACKERILWRKSRILSLNADDNRIPSLINLWFSITKASIIHVLTSGTK